MANRLLSAVQRFAVSWSTGIDAVCNTVLGTVTDSLRAAWTKTRVLQDPDRDNKRLSDTAYHTVCQHVEAIESATPTDDLVAGAADDDKTLLAFFGLAVVAALRVIVGASAQNSPRPIPCQDDEAVLGEEEVSYEKKCAYIVSYIILCTGACCLDVSKNILVGKPQTGE